jgi:hypothetical protein
MRVFAVASLIGTALLAATALSVASSVGVAVGAASCSDAIYTSTANAPPKPVRAIRIGPAVFNSLARLTTPRGLDKPTKALPFYSVKSPLTILARARRGVTIKILAGKGDAALVYDRRWLQRLASWHYPFSQVPASVRLPLCRDASTRQPLNTQFAGGFLLRKPTCVTIEVQSIGESKKRRAKIPLGTRC